MLSGEENFNQYFANAERVDRADAAAVRLQAVRHRDRASDRASGSGSTSASTSQAPERADRFGWVVEIDPYDPLDAVKHTTLGRFKHEGATSRSPTTAGRGGLHAATTSASTTSTSSSRPARTAGRLAHAREHNMTLLDEGTLYVAKFTGDGRAEIDGTGSALGRLFDGRDVDPAHQRQHVVRRRA